MTITTEDVKTKITFCIEYKHKDTGNTVKAYVYTLHEALERSRQVKSAGHEILSRTKITETENNKQVAIIVNF